MSAAKLLDEGKLAEAVRAAVDEVKRQPGEVGPRWLLAELLSLQGDLERADKHLEALLTQHPDRGMAIVQFRNLLRGEQARREVAFEGRVPEFLTEPTEAARASLAALVSLRAGDAQQAARLAAEAEQARPRLAGTCDGASFDDLRDPDDIYGPLLEFLTGDGRCGWLPLAHVASLEIQPHVRARDLAWRHARIVTHAGQRAEVFVPMLYPSTYRESDDALKLARTTDWKELAPGLFQGTGQRMWLVGDEVRPLLEIREIKLVSPEP